MGGGVPRSREVPPRGFHVSPRMYVTKEHGPTMKSRVWTTIDFDATGAQSDYARVPYSSNKSAYGWIPVPMFCFKGGDGPTALLTAGTHGDEYEGQIALWKLARELDYKTLRGRVIILPALNQPAVVAARRNSPLDGGNLNRLFPGDALGGPTAMIAHYVSSELMPLADLSIDLHSGELARVRTIRDGAARPD